MGSYNYWSNWPHHILCVCVVLQVQKTDAIVGVFNNTALQHSIQKKTIFDAKWKIEVNTLEAILSTQFCANCKYCQSISIKHRCVVKLPVRSKVYANKK